MTLEPQTQPQPPPLPMPLALSLDATDQRDPQSVAAPEPHPPLVHTSTLQVEGEGITESPSPLAELGDPAPLCLHPSDQPDSAQDQSSVPGTGALQKCDLQPTVSLPGSAKSPPEPKSATNQGSDNAPRPLILNFLARSPSVDSEPKTSCEDSVDRGELENDDDDGYMDGNSSNLFVGDLSRSLTEQDLSNAFAVCGEVVETIVKRDKVTGKNLGYGFVRMADRAQAEEAMAKLQGAEVGGRKIRIGWAQRNTRLYVGGLIPNISVEALVELFSRYGPLYEEDTILKEARKGSGKFGFVRFVRREDAETARRELQGGTSEFPSLRVDWHHGNSPKQLFREVIPTSVLLADYSLYVQFEADSVGVDVTPETLQMAFQHLGPITSSAVKAKHVSEDTGRIRGYGFVHFAGNPLGRKAATVAVQTMSGVVIQGVRYQAEYSNSTRRQTASVIAARQGALMPGAVPLDYGMVSSPYVMSMHGHQHGLPSGLHDPSVYPMQMQYSMSHHSGLGPLQLNQQTPSADHCQLPVLHTENPPSQEDMAIMAQQHYTLMVGSYNQSYEDTHGISVTSMQLAHIQHLHAQAHRSMGTAATSNRYGPMITMGTTNTPRRSRRPIIPGVSRNKAAAAVHRAPNMLQIPAVPPAKMPHGVQVAQVPQIAQIPASRVDPLYVQESAQA